MTDCRQLLTAFWQKRAAGVRAGGFDGFLATFDSFLAKAGGVWAREF